MAYFPLQPRYYVFTDSLNTPLENGYIYIGDANLDPQAYPAKVSWDKAGLYPVTFPIRTIGGYAVRDGLPTDIYINIEDNYQYSILIQDEDEVEVFSSSTGLAGYFPSDTGGDATTLQGHDASYFAVNAAVVHLAGAETITGAKTITNNSVTPLTLDGTAIAKILLTGATDPLIRFQEGTTNKAYLQWQSAGYIFMVNQEDGSALRIKDDLDFSLDGVTYYSIWHKGNDTPLAHLAGTETFTGNKVFQGTVLISSLTGNGTLTLSAQDTTRDNYIAFQAALTTRGQIQYNHNAVAANDVLNFNVGGASNTVATFTNNSILLPNTYYLEGNNTGATPLELVGINGSNIFDVGNTTVQTNIRSNGTLSYNGATLASGSIDTTATQTITVVDGLITSIV